ncbi:MAG: PTS transporter subunit EIIC [Solobacterium sp.]|nr:PTS transporter subunit EIIC [Solobacterium sp.]
MTIQELAQTILDHIGGIDNIKDAANCMTRLRITVYDPEKIDDAALGSTEGVLGVIHDERDYVQIVIGPGKVLEVMKELQAHGIHTGTVREEKTEKTEKKEKTGFLSGFRVFSDIFTPMIPAFMASGLASGAAGILALCVKASILPDVSAVETVRQMFLLISNGFLGYLAVFTGMQSARQFGADPMLGGLLGGASISAVINTISEGLGWYNASMPNDSFLSAGAGGILGVVFGVWVLAKAEKWFHKHFHGVWDTILTPVMTMIAVIPVYVLMIMPVSGFLSAKIASFLSLFLYSDSIVISALTGYVLAALFLPMVMAGLHRGLLPVYVLQIEKMGTTTLFPTVAMAGGGQVGAALALLAKAKKIGNTRLQNVIRGAVPAGVMGIGEPLIYGVTLPLAKPFITAGLGAGFGGAWCMVRHVMSTAYSVSGIPAFTIMAAQSMLDYLIGWCIACIMGAVITYIFIPASITAET